MWLRSHFRRRGIFRSRAQKSGSQIDDDDDDDDDDVNDVDDATELSSVLSVKAFLGASSNILKGSIPNNF